MSKDKDSGKIISLDAFRQAQGEGREDKETPPESQAITPDMTDSPFEIFYDLLSIPAMTPENTLTAMRNLLRSLNSQFALAAQKTELPENAGMYNAHLRLTQLNFSEETMNEIGESFGRKWREKKTRDYYRFVKLHEGKYIEPNGDEHAASLIMPLRRKAIETTPAYKDLKGELTKIFPTASFKPSIYSPAFNSFTPCICIDAPLDGPDLRAQIKDYLNTPPTPDNKPDLRPV